MLQKLVKNVSAGHASSASGTIVSIIAADVRIVGNIISQGDLQIDGQVEGNITCQTLVVGELARISGEVTAERVKVHGELTGKINATVISITHTARVLGDVTHESLEVEVGAQMEGHCIRKGGISRPEPRRIEVAVAELEPAET